MVADFSWRGLLRRRSQAASPEPSTRPTVMFDPDKLHPAWRHGGGFELRLGDGPGTPITLDGLRTHIAAARFVHGDDEADRLQTELDGLLAIKKRCEGDGRPPQPTSAGSGTEPTIAGSADS